MADEIEVSGVVVSCMPIGEYDKRVVIITAELGRIHAFARGARRTNSKLLAGTKDIDRVYYGFYFLELASYFSRENIGEKALVNLIYMAFKALEAKVDKLTPEFIKAIFEWKIFEIEGIMPGIDEGIFLGKKLKPSTTYAIKMIAVTDITKLFSFDLEAESKMEFIKLAEEYRDLNTDIQFKSLEMIREV